MNIKPLVSIANKLDSMGYFDLADELDSIILSLAEEPTPDLMTEKEIESEAEDIVMLLAHQLSQSGYDISGQELLKIFEDVGTNPDAIAREIEKRRQ